MMILVVASSGSIPRMAFNASEDGKLDAGQVKGIHRPGSRVGYKSSANEDCQTLKCKMY